MHRPNPPEQPNSTVASSGFHVCRQQKQNLQLYHAQTAIFRILFAANHFPA
jgi:hypothetical protein